VTCITFMLEVFFFSCDNVSVLVSTVSTCIRVPNRHGLLLSKHIVYVTRHSNFYKFQYSITSVLEPERGSNTLLSAENSLWRRLWTYLKLLKPTGYVMHHQFNIQQLCALPTLYLCVMYLSQNKQILVPQHKLIGFHNRGGKCLQRGTDWGFK
jgi:hypothetical protein